VCSTFYVSGINHQAMQGEGCMRRGLRIISAVECSPVLPVFKKVGYEGYIFKKLLLP